MHISPMAGEVSPTDDRQSKANKHALNLSVLQYILMKPPHLYLSRDFAEPLKTATWQPRTDFHRGQVRDRLRTGVAQTICVIF